MKCLLLIIWCIRFLSKEPPNCTTEMKVGTWLMVVLHLLACGLKIPTELWPLSQSAFRHYCFSYLLAFQSYCPEAKLSKWAVLSYFNFQSGIYMQMRPCSQVRKPQVHWGVVRSCLLWILPWMPKWLSVLARIPLDAEHGYSEVLLCSGVSTLLQRERVDRWGWKHQITPGKLAGRCLSVSGIRLIETPLTDPKGQKKHRISGLSTIKECKLYQLQNIL